MVFNKNVTDEKREGEEGGRNMFLSKCFFSLLTDPINDVFSCPGGVT